LRFLLNENIPGTVVNALRSQGHDALWAKEQMRGAGDAVILARAQLEQRILVTQDKDFGELAFRARLPATCGIVLFRLAGISPEPDKRKMVDVLTAGRDWAGHFAVVDEMQIRMRPLPPRAAE
jgi:predicted nuclease of predicted toxin-antitoxin system